MAYADEPTRELAGIMHGMYDAHLQNRADLDELLRRLLSSESKLEDIVGGEADGKALVICRRWEADHAMESHSKSLEDCQDELAQLLDDRDAKIQEEQKLRDELTDEERREAAVGPASLCSDAAEILGTMSELEERERYLRELEKREIDKDDIVEDRRKSLAALKQEYDELYASHGHFFQQAEARMQDQQAQIQDSRRELVEAESQRDAVAARTGALRSSRDDSQRYHQQLVEVRGALEEDLERCKQLKAVGEVELKEHLDALNSSPDPDVELMKLEEVMMLLKGAAINLATDHCFVGEVNQLASAAPFDDDRGLSAFCNAFRYVRTYVESTQGPQVPGERWMPPEGQQWASVPDECIEKLLSALKQLVICFDMMYEEGKRRAPFARELVRNSSHLLDLIQETSVKYREKEIQAEEFAAAEVMAEEERRRQLEAKKYAPRAGRGPNPAGTRKTQAAARAAQHRAARLAQPDGTRSGSSK
eukprot:TRINITY_DN32540_c0_g1_i1.p1 TRINITY_DN32540_c0_g1~~TRINITY_DN32540_c0_g1_i1.p1  ORF type:complete len:479 (+),score=146.54 TRINITY_DN32540_c0_g1_i1:86-1522(+)